MRTFSHLWCILVYCRCYRKPNILALSHSICLPWWTSRTTHLVQWSLKGPFLVNDSRCGALYQIATISMTSGQNPPSGNFLVICLLATIVHDWAELGEKTPLSHGMRLFHAHDKAGNIYMLLKSQPPPIVQNRWNLWVRLSDNRQY
jgi:hypothetical protein